MKRNTYKYISIGLLIVLTASTLFVLRDTIFPPKTIPKKEIPQKQTRAIPVKKSYLGLIQEAEELIEKQHFPKAANNLSSAIKQKPDQIKPYLLLGEMYVRTQQNDKLTNLIQELGQKFPTEDATAILEARRLIMNHEYEEALKTFTTNQEILPPALSFYHATLLALQNDHETAQEKLKTILSYDKEDHQVADNTEQNEENLQTVSPEILVKAEGLLDIYEQFETISDGKNPHLFALLSKSLSENNEAHLAKEFATNAIKEDVSYIDAWVLRGYASFLLQEYDSALKDLEYAYEIAPERTNTHYFLGLTYLETEQLDKATLFLEKVLDTDFAFSREVRWKLVDLYTKQKKYDKVLELYDELLAESDNPKDYVSPLQMAIEVLNKPETALEFTSKLIKKDPQNFISYNFHAWALIANEQYHEAKETLEQALEIKPDNPGSYLYLGLLYEEQQKFSKALEYYKKSYEFGKDTSEIGITQLAAQKHNQLAEQKNRPTQPQASERDPNSP